MEPSRTCRASAVESEYRSTNESNRPSDMAQPSRGNVQASRPGQPRAARFSPRRPRAERGPMIVRRCGFTGCPRHIPHNTRYCPDHQKHRNRTYTGRAWRNRRWQIFEAVDFPLNHSRSSVLPRGRQIRRNRSRRLILIGRSCETSSPLGFRGRARTPCGGRVDGSPRPSPGHRTG
jgi:hypothetical protein